MKRLLLLIALGASLAQLPAQGDTRNWTLSGYLKNMQTLLFFNEAYPDLSQGQLVDTFFQDNLIHNRLNFRWYPADKWTVRADLRTRVFYGSFVQASPGYGDQVDDVNNDYFDLSHVILNEEAWVMHTMLDRLYLEYVNDKLEIRLGRQRINWGISTVWNPNDIFNAFAFTDFDYEERPGSDALRVKYYTGFASSVEVAVSAFDDFDEATFAGLWKFNQWAYDFQVLAGYTRGDLAMGGGWAGNILDAGLKGEFTYFLPVGDHGANASFSATLGLDYSFSNSLYASLGYLYNSEGGTQNSITGLFDFELSARDLYPYRHALFAQGSYPVTPLFNTGLAVIYSPVRANALFLNPTFTYSIRANWDLDLIGQIAFDREAEGYRSPLQAAFFRLKWSF